MKNQCHMNRYFFSLFFLALLFWGLSSSIFGVQAAPQKLKISVEKDNLLGDPPKDSFVRKVGNKYEAVLTGELYIKPLSLPLNPTSLQDRSTPEKSLSIDHLANLKGNTDLILKGWLPQDHEALQNIFKDGKMMERNQKGVAAIRSIEVYGYIRYKGFHLMLVVNNGQRTMFSSVVMTMKKTGSSWLLTNALSGDPVINLIWAAHATNSIKIEEN